MSSFEDRKKSFEKKFAHDQELQFKVSARRNKYLGEWVSGDEDVFRKIKQDLKEKNISDEELRKKMDELNEKAKTDFS